MRCTRGDVRHRDVYRWDHICSDAFLGGGRLGNDVRTPQKERQCTLLDFVRRTNARRRQTNRSSHGTRPCKTGYTHPNVLSERKSSCARLSCSHLVITGPPSRDAPDKLSP